MNAPEGLSPWGIFFGKRTPRYLCERPGAFTEGITAVYVFRAFTWQALQGSHPSTLLAEGRSSKPG